MACFTKEEVLHLAPTTCCIRSDQKQKTTAFFPPQKCKTENGKWEENLEATSHQVQRQQSKPFNDDSDIPECS